MKMNLRISDEDGVITYEFWGRGFSLKNVSYKTNTVESAVRAAKRTAKRFQIECGKVTYCQPLISHKEYKLRIKGLNY